MLEQFVDYINNFLLSIGIFAPIISCLFILIESIVPILPLCLFITINFLFFGKLIGFVISWVFTCLGCFLSYYLCSKGYNFFSCKRGKNSDQLNKYHKFINNLSFPFLSAIIAIPFTPAFAINIVAGLSKMPFKKFSCGILIGKIFMVYFWGFIGSSLIESIKNPSILIRVGLMVAFAIIISLVLNKLLKIKEAQEKN